MLLWSTGLAVLGVATIFRSVGIDYRLVALGALLPLVVDLPVGHRSVGHTLLFPVVLLAAVMLGTVGRPRLLRRRLLCLPVGVFAGLVLSGAFTDAERFWWPALGAFHGGGLLGPWWWVLVRELVGLVAWWWVIGLYDLYLPEPRRLLWSTGRLSSPTC
jgi:hypothetical protein